MEQKLITSAEQLSFLNDRETATEKGPKSAMDKRKAYENLLVQQKESYGGQCNFTMFNLFTSYSANVATAKDKSKCRTPPLLKVDEDGIINLTKHTKKFIVRDTVFYKIQKRL